DEARVLRTGDPFERPDQDVVDVAGEEEADDEGEEERDQRLDQPRAQLDQVLHQRRLGRLDLLLVFFRLHAALSPSGLGAGGAGVAGAAAVSMKSFVSGGGGNSGIGTDTSTAGGGATGAVPSATGSVEACCCGAVGSEGGVAGDADTGGVEAAAGSWIIFSSSFLMSVVSKVEVTADAVSSNCFFRSAISAS